MYDILVISTVLVITALVITMQPGRCPGSLVHIFSHTTCYNYHSHMVFASHMVFTIIVSLPQEPHKRYSCRHCRLQSSALSR